MDLQI